MTLNQKTIYDISLVIPDESVLNPGDPAYRRTLRLSLERGDVCDVSGFAMSTHFGTHLDVPSHFFPERKSLDDYCVGDFFFPAVVALFEDPRLVKPAELEAIEIDAGDALLCKTRNSMSGLAKSGVFTHDFVSLSPEAALMCVEKKVSLVGIDYGSVDRYDDEVLPAHRTLLGNDIIILEGINLKDVPPGRYTLVCLPMKIKRSEASPVRAILMQ